MIAASAAAGRMGRLRLLVELYAEAMDYGGEDGWELVNCRGFLLGGIGNLGGKHENHCRMSE